MPTVLVVDDSAVDRHLVRGLLAKDPTLKVETAENGKQALSQMAHSMPQLVLTDIRMPEMDGLQLVAQIRRRYPLVPVVVMTSRGSEATAIEALRHGAASYVSKRTLARDLSETIESVLAVSTQRQGFSRLMSQLVDFDASFVLENDAELFPPLVSMIQEQVMYAGLCGESERVRLGVAVEEALANALFHGNLEISSELRESDTAAYHALALERAGQPPYCKRRIYVRARIDRDEALLVIRDEGQGFLPSDVPDPTKPENLDRVSGRGLLLIRTFMDETRYNETGNEITMVKRRDGERADERTDRIAAGEGSGSSGRREGRGR